MTKKEQKELGRVLMTAVDDYSQLTLYLVNHKTKEIQEITDEPINILIKVMTIPEEDLPDMDVEIGIVTDENLY